MEQQETNQYQEIQKTKENISKTKKWIYGGAIATGIGLVTIVHSVYSLAQSSSLERAYRKELSFLRDLNKKQNQFNQNENFEYLGKEANKEITAYTFAKGELEKLHEIKKKETERLINELKKYPGFKAIEAKETNFFLESGMGILLLTGGLISFARKGTKRRLKTELKSLEGMTQ